MSRRALLLLPLFFIEVHVKASEPEPAAKETSCWGKEVPCAIDSGSRLRKLESDGFLVTLSPDSLIEHKETDSMRLVKGRFYIRVSKPVQFKTPYAQFSCSGHCQGLAWRQQDQITWKAI